MRYLPILSIAAAITLPSLAHADFYVGEIRNAGSQEGDDWHGKYFGVPKSVVDRCLPNTQGVLYPVIPQEAGPFSTFFSLGVGASSEQVPGMCGNVARINFYWEEGPRQYVMFIDSGNGVPIGTCKEDTTFPSKLCNSRDTRPWIYCTTTQCN